MYKLWKEKYITKPSEYWNMGIGDKIVTRAFYERDIEEKNKFRMELKRNKTPIFPATIV